MNVLAPTFENEWWFTLISVELVVKFLSPECRLASPKTSSNKAVGPSIWLIVSPKLLMFNIFEAIPFCLPVNTRNTVEHHRLLNCPRVSIFRLDRDHASLPRQPPDFPPKCSCQGPWNVDLRTPPGPEGSNGSLLCVCRGHPDILHLRFEVLDLELLLTLQVTRQ